MINLYPLHTQSGHYVLQKGRQTAVCVSVQSYPDNSLRPKPEAVISPHAD